MYARHSFSVRPVGHPTCQDDPQAALVGLIEARLVALGDPGSDELGGDEYLRLDYRGTARVHSHVLLPFGPSMPMTEQTILTSPSQGAFAPPGSVVRKQRQA